jgi:PAS domain S-box-containing protein
METFKELPSTPDNEDGGETSGNANTAGNSFDRQRTEEALTRLSAEVTNLRFMTERFEYASRATQDVVWDWNLEDNSVWWSDTFTTVFGYVAEEIKETSDFWYSLIHPDDRDMVVGEIHRLINSGESLWFAEYRFRKADGNYCLVQDRGYVRHSKEMKPLRMVGSMRDISKPRRNEQQLLQQTERLRLAVESTGLGTWDYDPSKGVLDWDSRCKELFGLPADAAVDWQLFLQGVHPDDRERVDKINRDAMAEGSDGNYDCEYRTVGIVDKKLRWVRAKGRSHFDPDGRAQRYIGTVLDITAQKVHEQKIIDQELLFRVLVASIPQIVWTTDTAGKTDYISQRWEDYTGLSENDAGRNFASLIHPDDLNHVLTSWRESLHSGLPWTAEYRLRNSHTGIYRWFSGAIAPLKNENGTIIKWIGSAGDIHEQKLLEHELERRVADRTTKLAAANAQLQQSNRELEQFAYVASHDLQEPLRKVSMYLGMLKGKLPAPTDENVDIYFQKIDKATMRMSALIKNLLDYSRLDKDQAITESVDLNKILAEVIVDFEMALGQKSITVAIEDLPIVHGVPHQLNQLFYNLIGNAIKFSKVTGDSFIRIRCSYEAEYYRISIADNGVGFDQKYAVKMFEIFQRLTTGKSVSGHGIGLAICQKIVHNHRGTIEAFGREGEGAEFIISLPVSR